jgi:hypothetical protein
MRADRLRHQRLTGPGLPGPVEVITWLGAVQAQDFAGALWALAQRIESPVTAADLQTAFDAGAFIRTHILRPTWHVVAAADLRWMLALSAPRVQAACSRGYRRLGIDARTRLRAERVMQRALEGGRHLTRHGVAAALRQARIATEDQRLVYLLMHAELEGLICSGPRHAGQHTYALVDERVPAASRLVREEALARLMLRYFTSHGPATAKDAAWWSGLTLGDVREGVALAGDALEDRLINGRYHWQGSGLRASRVTRGGVVHLLSNFDEYTVAYRDRGALLHPSVPMTSATQLALLSQPVMVDGRSAGTWRRLRSTVHRPPSPGEARHGSVGIAVTTYSPLSPLRVRALERAAARYGEYLQVGVNVNVQ